MRWQQLSLPPACSIPRRDALRGFYSARHGEAAAIVARAIAAGEVDPQVDATEIIRLAVAPLFHRLFITHEPVTAEQARRAADVAARSGENTDRHLNQLARQPDPYAQARTA
ncbi:TetR/AcrR family transcriptional regulator C-terminal ligand-binding domain-containing protein [Nocardia fluminea]|uniref:TetR/AcrR family transcriptional regulator C-terminal ligand-binding domain-containing protein n=1 Tax=Nocardia fluminea TaxID=134984 RepID=UPI0033E24A05